MPFTKEELEEMRRADEEIEASFCLTNEDLRFSRALDREAEVERMDPRKRKVAAYKRAYREANREKVAAYKRAYREANREKVAASQRAYREANREKVAAYKRAYYEANREKVAASQRDLLKAYRKESGMTQRDFAKIAGVSSQLVSHWETGRAELDPERIRAALPELARRLEAEHESFSSL